MSWLQLFEGRTDFWIKREQLWCFFHERCIFSWSFVIIDFPDSFRKPLSILLSCTFRELEQSSLTFPHQLESKHVPQEKRELVRRLCLRYMTGVLISVSGTSFYRQCSLGLEFDLRKHSSWLILDSVLSVFLIESITTLLLNRPLDFEAGHGASDSEPASVQLPEEIVALAQATPSRPTGDHSGFRFSVSVLPSWAQKKVRGGEWRGWDEKKER